MLVLVLAKAIKSLFLGRLTRDEVEVRASCITVSELSGYDPQRLTNGLVGVQDLVQNSKFTVTELCLALTIFREELNFRTLALFTALLFVKVFHWLATARVENVCHRFLERFSCVLSHTAISLLMRFVLRRWQVARSEGLSLLTHLRLISLLAFLALVDVTFVVSLSVTILTSMTPSVLLLFAFEVRFFPLFLLPFISHRLTCVEWRWVGGV
jgi:hypothetical protein